jgi:hypothetical protein
MNAFADPFFLIAHRLKDGDGRVAGRLIVVADTMKENDVAQNDDQDHSLKIDKAQNYPMSEVISHIL